MSQQWKVNEGGDEDVQMPLGAGGGAEAPAEEYSASRKPKINGSTIALVVAFAAGLVVLYFLGLGNKPRAATAEQVQQQQLVSNKIEALLGDKNKVNEFGKFLDDSARLVDRLKQYFASISIPELNVNPFERDMPRTEAVAIKDPFPKQPDIITEDPVAAREMREAGAYFATLKLQMTMMGSPSVAMINNSMCTPGTKLKMFTITEIKPDCVILTFKEQTYTLASATPGGGKP